jgi:hypothetical protein
MARVSLAHLGLLPADVAPLDFGRAQGVALNAAIGMLALGAWSGFSAVVSACLADFAAWRWSPSGARIKGRATVATRAAPAAA